MVGSYATPTISYNVYIYKTILSYLLYYIATKKILLIPIQ